LRIGLNGQVGDICHLNAHCAVHIALTDDRSGSRDCLVLYDGRRNTVRRCASRLERHQVTKPPVTYISMPSIGTAVLAACWCCSNCCT
jgi:hypothetical protein